MTTATVYEVVTEAAKKSGVLGLGQTLDGDDLVSMLLDFNDMVSQWNTKRFLIWHEVDIAFVSTATSPLTVGPGGNFNVTTAPTRIKAAYQRQLITTGLNVDTPIEIIPSYEEFSRLSLKQLQSFGLYGFYDSAYPTGNLWLYPIPQASIYEVHILLQDVIPVFTASTVSSVLSLPAYYIAGMKFNLARRIRQAYGKGLRPDPELNQLARESLDTIKNANWQVPELVMPRTLIIQSSGYNILSDQFGNS